MANAQVSQEAVQDYALAQYLAITRKAGLSDDLAVETYKANKSSADALAALSIKNTIDAGERMKKIVSSTPTKNVGGVAGERLIQLIERIERLQEEKAGISDDIRDIYAEAKSAGFETKIMRQLVKLRAMNADKRREQEELLDLYKSAIGID